MDQQILGFELYSTHPEALERFLSDVLSFDIESGEGLFRAQLAHGVALTVQQGSGPGLRLKIGLAPESFHDLPARFEFFSFRYPDHPHVSWFPHKAVFVTKDGHEWSVTPVQTLTVLDHEKISVRNC